MHKKSPPDGGLFGEREFRRSILLLPQRRPRRRTSARLRGGLDSIIVPALCAARRSTARTSTVWLTESLSSRTSVASPTLSRNTRLRPTDSGGTRETTSSRPTCMPSTSGPGSSTTSNTVLVWNSSRNAPPISSSNNALVSASNWNSLVLERPRMEPVPARPLYGPVSLRYSTPRLWNMTFVTPVRSTSWRAQTASMIVRSMRVRPSCVISASSPV